MAKENKQRRIYLYEDANGKYRNWDTATDLAITLMEIAAEVLRRGGTDFFLVPVDPQKKDVDYSTDDINDYYIDSLD